jgi:hypothetical protein
MAKMGQDEMMKIAERLDAAVEKAVSALTKAGVPEYISQSACVDAISHRMTHMNVMNQDTKIAKAAVFALHCENIMQMLLSRVFDLAETCGIANSDRDAMKIQTVVISAFIGHAIDGCLVSTDSNEEARDLYNTITNVVWEAVRLKRQNLDMEEESNAEGSSSVH